MFCIASRLQPEPNANPQLRSVVGRRVHNPYAGDLGAAARAMIRSVIDL